MSWIEYRTKLKAEAGRVAEEKIKSLLKLHGTLLQGHIRTRYLTGGTAPTKLGVRSGRLRSSVRVLEPREVRHGVFEGGVSIGTEYARTHFGPPGQVTTIKPKSAKYLTIPLKDALTGAGVAKGSARNGPWGATFIRKSKAGNLIIWGRKLVTKGPKGGTFRGEIIPLFLLKKEVKIKARINPMVLVRWAEKGFREDLAKLDWSK